MATYIITFLGIFARETEYEFEGKKEMGEVFPQALIKFVKFDRMFVCVTKDARIKTYPILEKLNDDRIEAISIEDGATTDQMWSNFKEIVSKFESGDKVIFDITHAARSIPFLTFLFSAYLKVAKKVQIIDVYYGAQVFGSTSPKQLDPSVVVAVEKSKPAPVIKLGEFVSMLDWMSYTQRFVDLGDGNGLAELLKEVDVSDAKLKTIVTETATEIERVSDALIYIRPMEVMESVAKLQELIPKLEAQGQNLPQLQPFLLLCEQILDRYQNLALAKPFEEVNLPKNLECQLKMMDWYQQHQQQVKSIMLGRELFVSILMYWQGKGEIFDYKSRKPAENILNGHGKDANFDQDQFVDSQKIKATWKKATELRNDFAHSGMSSSPDSIKSLRISIGRVIEEITTCLEEFLKVAAKNRQQPEQPKLRK